MTRIILATFLGALVGCTADSPATTATATASLAALGTSTVTGDAKFTESGTDIAVTFTLHNCVDTKSYPVHIHEGTACTDNTTQGGHWAVPRGEGIPNIVCAGTTATMTYTRTALPAASAWTIGGDATTNVEGHVIVVHDPDTAATRIACGAITP